MFTALLVEYTDFLRGLGWEMTYRMLPAKYHNKALFKRMALVNFLGEKVVTRGQVITQIIWFQYCAGENYVMLKPDSSPCC
jgi:hypothetical protein